MQYIRVVTGIFPQNTAKVKESANIAERTTREAKPFFS
jgi:hypothetical protein